MAPPQHICSKRGGSPGETTVWQSNCRGYKNKHGSLIQYIATSTRPPEIIALQQTNTHVRLPGYVTYGTDMSDSLHTLVSKKLVAVQHHLQQCKPLAILLEIIPQATKKKGPMFVVNAYCRPKSTPSVLKQVLEQATHAAGNHPLLIVGDFNAAHPLWSYTYTNPRGNLLHKVIEDMDLTLVNHPRSSTRLGTSVTRDTNRDLTLTRNIPQACWTNLAEYLGSGQALLATTRHGLEYKARIGTARLTDWTKLREIREERATNEQSLQLQSIKDWITQLHQHVKAHTKILETHPPHQTVSLPHAIRSNITVPPLPRYMHPVHHAQRREARARAIHKRYGTLPSTAYTDAGSYPRRAATTATVIVIKKHRSSISLTRYNPLQAEEAAIALALSQTQVEVIVTDSQQACRNFASGRIHATTLKIINQKPPTRSVIIIWAPAHHGIPGNEVTNHVARDLTHRADAEESEPERMHPLVSYQDITQHYKLTRRTYAPPHKSLPREQERFLRALQVNTFPHPTRNHLIAPTQFSPQCRFCAEPGSLRHIVGGCREAPLNHPNPYHTNELWERALASSNLEDQQRLIARAQDAARAQGIME
ncbi:hypothetical protein HPB49_012635 [Dermacentor silvarum]|uniref:Uncharacterized protein n=1 Tax=Dermacentor silvarum TaxID=543639 RepID=A0ACB8DP05_DERSI|nr:hypothetical protein HPB49_012635 [Dermacentor silvarum]